MHMLIILFSGLVHRDGKVFEVSLFQPFGKVTATKQTLNHVCHGKSLKIYMFAGRKVKNSKC